MILKARHLYKLVYGKQEYYKDIEGYRGYCLVSPVDDIVYDNISAHIRSYAHIDVFGTFNTDSSIFFGEDWNVTKPSVNDAFEIAHRTKNTKYRYNFKTNEIILK